MHPRERRPDERRADWKRRVIVDAAREVFLQHGYLGTSMDEIAARAAVSKQTVYGHFADKETLFAEIVMATTVGVLDDLGSAAGSTLGGDPASALTALAHRYLDGLLRPEVVALRRLVIAEAERFPELARAWFERGFTASLAAVAAALAEMAERGQLRAVDDPVLAANQFAGLVMYAPMNDAMFRGPEAGATPAAARERIAASAVRVFLAAYGPA